MHWQAQVIALMQEANTYALASLNELRDIHKGIDDLAGALPQPLGLLKRVASVFGEPK